jgi:hypothetical protein
MPGKGLADFLTPAAVSSETLVTDRRINGLLSSHVITLHNLNFYLLISTLPDPTLPHPSSRNQ